MDYNIIDDAANFTDVDGNISVATAEFYNLKFTYTKPTDNWEVELNSVTE